MIHEACDGDMTCKVKFHCENTETEVLGCGFRNKVGPPPSAGTSEMEDYINTKDQLLCRCFNHKTMFPVEHCPARYNPQLLHVTNLHTTSRVQIYPHFWVPTPHYTHHSHHSHSHPLLSLLNLNVRGSDSARRFKKRPSLQYLERYNMAPRAPYYARTPY
jgi:hypothetical protein